MRITPALAACLLICTVAHAGEPPTIRGIATITDGDTVRLGPVRVRLEGIDAPESGQHCKMADGTDWPCGAGATKYAGELAGVVECVVIGVDKYDRLLGTCGVLDAAGKPDGATLNQRMVTAGLAVAFTRYSQAYVGAEAEARAAKRGVWQGEFEMPWDFRARLKATSQAPAPSK